MVAIPKSFGIIQRPSTETGAANVNLSYGQILPDAISKLGKDIESFAIQQQQQQVAEDNAINAAKLIQFKTQLSKFDNEKKQYFKNISSSDINQVTAEHNKLYDERSKFVNQQLESYKSNPALFNLAKNQADTNSVDFENDLAVELSKKNKQFGQNQIYGSIYNINTQIESGGNLNNAKRDLNETLRAGLKTGLINMQDVIREKDKQQQIVKQKLKDYEERVAFNTVVNGKTYLNPDDSRSQKIIDSGFGKAALSNRNPEQLGYDLSINSGIIPSQFKNILSGRLNVGNPQDQVRAASTIIEMIEKNPNLQDQFRKQDLMMANEMRNNIDMNLPADQVVKYARDSLNAIKSLDKKARINLVENKDYKTQIESNYKSLENSLKDESGIDFYKGSVVVDPSLRIHYDQLVKNAIVSDGYTPDGALSAAADKIKKEWAITNIGQRRLQRGAPEAIYQNYGDTSWIKGQLAAKIAEHELTEKEVDLNKFTIAPIPQSMTGKPSYSIQKQNAYGAFDFVRDSQNQIVVFTPDITKTEKFLTTQKELKILHQSATDLGALTALRKAQAPSEMQKAIKLGARTK